MKSLFKFLLFLLPLSIYGQVTDTIEVSFTKSCYLLLPKAPKFDFGSEDVIVRQSENKLIIQAGKEDFEETNLFVQIDETIYLFIIRYSNSPKKFIYNYSSTGNNQTNIGTGGASTSNTDNSILNIKNKELIDKAKLDSIFKPICERVISKGGDYLNEGEINFGNLVWCSAIYADEEYLYFKIRIDNTTNIPYEADYSSYTIRDKKDLLKKKAIQDYETQPLYIYNPFQIIGPQNKLQMIVVFKKFTIDKDKVLTAEVWEKNGDRRMKIDISGRVILKSKLLNSIQ